jgi:type VI protein secretion system component VasK
VISIAFLRFYAETDFTVLGQFASPRSWSNRLTVAALLVALVNFGVEWNSRNREADRRAEAEQRRREEEQRRREAEARATNERAEEAERAARRTRIQNRWIVLQARYLLSPSTEVEAALADFFQFLQEYGEI